MVSSLSAPRDSKLCLPLQLPMVINFGGELASLALFTTGFSGLRLRSALGANTSCSFFLSRENPQAIVLHLGKSGLIHHRALELFTRKKTSSEPINLGGGLASLARGGPGARLRLGANTSCSQKSALRFFYYRVLGFASARTLRVRKKTLRAFFVPGKFASN